MAALPELLDARDPPPLRVGVVAPLQRDVDQGIGYEVDLRSREESHELEGVGVVVGAKRGRVARGDARSHPRPYGLGRHDLEEPGVRVVGLVAVYVYRPVVLL